MPRKINKARAYIYGVPERRRILALNRSNALIAAAILVSAERRLLPVNRPFTLPTGFPVVFCLAILLLYTALSLDHVFYTNM